MIDSENPYVLYLDHHDKKTVYASCCHYFAPPRDVICIALKLYIYNVYMILTDNDDRFDRHLAAFVAFGTSPKMNAQCSKIIATLHNILY